MSGLATSLAPFFLLAAHIDPGAASRPSHPAGPEGATHAVLDDGSSLLSRTLEPFTGDLPEIWRRGQLRVLVPYSHTEFFVSKGRPGGYDYEMALRFQQYLNARRPKDAAALSIVFAPTPVEQVLPDLLAGKGDVAAGLVMVTPMRRQVVAFAQPHITGLDQVVVRHKAAAPIRSLEELSGRPVHVLAGSSHAERLKSLNERLSAGGREPAQVLELAAPASPEDVLHMVSAGIFQYAISDGFVAQEWSQVLPGLVVEATARVSSGDEVAWAVRPANRELLAALNGYVSQHSHEARVTAAVLFRKYYQSRKPVLNPIGPEHITRVRDLSPFFREAGEKYGFDWLLLCAQALQESQFDPRARNRSGAVGLMQVLPNTAQQMGYPDVESPRMNVLAGAAYLNHLRQVYFAEDGLDPAEKIYFSLAAYNAGPHVVRELRARARHLGLDPARWFGHVEVVAQHVIGDETVDYVANISRYYLAYRLSDSQREVDAGPD
ncbi:MAG TPA: transporter substrate-binding domain-containing protein [Anaeromyxobacteraceae bacterium]|nr:transporter substrate-binding domain-containing protein [Anaeromyxobacteraceae bacterium]